MHTSTGVGRADSERAGLAVLIAGVALIIAALGSALTEWLWVIMLIGFIGLVYGIPGIHRYQAPADGAPGKWGAWLVRAGGLIVTLLGVVFLVWEAVGTVPEEDPAIIVPLWMIGFFGFAIGMILFVIGTLKANVLPRGAAILMIVGLVGAIAIDMATGAFFEDDTGTTTEWGFYIGVPLFGLGLAWLGNTVWKGRAAATNVTANAARGSPPS